ncbi:MAG: DUF389 domain-containing protein [Proteobacteria bacterium]|nr:MAG: DUF389 domain-containing protein [Pseudomonadota bacterium]
MANVSSKILRFKRQVAVRFSLRNDQAETEVIDASLRSGVELVGSTPWILMFAILVACIGLNVNSTAVIIGAMLVSPLMGPIMGIGYGIGIYDFALVKHSFKNLGIAAAISLFTAFCYFLLTPLSEAQSELLSRTSPTIWDVLIALFGGMAGIIGITRKEKTNVIPGVAIATALMPPLCTAGYGFAQGNWRFVTGALYLFSINCVFIAISSAFVITILKMPHQTFVEEKVKKRVKHILLAIALVTTIPSIFLAFDLVKKEIFRNRAMAFIKQEFRFEQTHVADLSVEPSDKRIEVSLIGQILDREKLNKIEQELSLAGVPGAKLIVHQGADNRVDINSIKEGIIGDLYRNNLTLVEDKNRKIEELEAKLNGLSRQELASNDILNEVLAQIPDAEKIVVGNGIAAQAVDHDKNQKVHLLKITVKKPVNQNDQAKFLRWFQARTKDPAAEVIIEQFVKAKSKR